MVKIAKSRLAEEPSEPGHIQFLLGALVRKLEGLNHYHRSMYEKDPTGRPTDRLSPGRETEAAASLQPVIDATLPLGLLARSAISVVMIAAVALPLGFCFPIGLRLVRRLSDDAMPWMWGMNGAFGVLASVTAIWISMWVGIDTSLTVALVLYLLLAIPASALWERAVRAG